jgi:hypothetical protein
MVEHSKINRGKVIALAMVCAAFMFVGVLLFGYIPLP